MPDPNPETAHDARCCDGPDCEDQGCRARTETALVECGADVPYKPWPCRLRSGHDGPHSDIPYSVYDREGLGAPPVDVGVGGTVRRRVKDAVAARLSRRDGAGNENGITPDAEAVLADYDPDYVCRTEAESKAFTQGLHVENIRIDRILRDYGSAYGSAAPNVPRIIEHLRGAIR